MREFFRRVGAWFGRVGAYWAQRVERVRARLLRIPFFRFVFHVIDEMGRDEVAERAATIAYYAFLSLFPLLLGLIALLGLFLPSASVQDALFAFFERSLPSATDFLRGNINQIIAMRGSLGLIAIIGLLWSGSGMFGAVNRAINRAWGVTRGRLFIVQRFHSLAIALGIVALFFLSLVLTSAFSVASSFVDGATGFTTSAVEFILMFGVFLLAYKVMPYTRTHWRYVWPGAAFAAVLFELARLLIGYYFSRLAHYQLVYGSISSLIILMLWFYYFAFILLLGAEVSAEYSLVHAGLDLKHRVPPEEPAAEKPASAGCR